MDQKTSFIPNYCCIAAATSSQGIMLRALVGQPLTQAPQVMHLVDFLVSGSTLGIPQGQA